MNSLKPEDVAAVFRRRGGAAAPIAPEPFVSGQWQVVDPGTGNSLHIVILALPETHGLLPIRIEFSLDRGAATALGPAEPGIYPVAAVTDVAVNIALRLVTAAGPGPWSDPITMTPTMLPEPPELLAQPTIDGIAEIGQIITAIPGEWRYATSVSTVLTVGGVPVASPYTLLLGDDGAAILLTETASGAGGTATATASATARHAAPTATGTIPDQTLDVDEVATLDVSGYFTGAGGAWSVSGTQSAGAAVSINAGGVIAFNTASAALGTVTVSYTNSGGTASRSFLLSVSAASGGGDVWTPDLQPNMVMWVADPDDVTVASDRVVEWRSRSNTMTSGTIAFVPYDQGSGQITPPSWDAATNTLSWGPGTDVVSALRAAITGGTQFGPQINGGLTIITLFETLEFLSTGQMMGFGLTSLGEMNQRGAWSQGRPHTSGTQGTTTEPRLSMRDIGKYIAITRVTKPAPGPRSTTWVNGVLAGGDETLAATDYPAADTIRVGAGPAVTDPAATAGTTSLYSTRVAAFAVVRGVLDDTQRKAIEGYLRWVHALASPIALPSGHPWAGTAPVVGSAPVLINPLPSLSVYPSAAIDEVNLAEFFGGATGYAISGDGLGLSVVGSYLRGTPTGSGTVTIVASNANGNTPSTLSLTVLAAPTVASDFAMLWSIAAAGSPGDSITLAEALTSLDPGVFETAALTGNTTATLVGYTDFRISGPMPAGTEYDNFRRVPHRKGDGTTVGTNTLPAHPLWTNAARTPQYLRGPEVQAPDVPFDHAVSLDANLPLGIRIETWEQPANFPYISTNGLRHIGIEHDGHILWVAEYLCEDGAVRTFMEEMDGTRALNPRFCHRNGVNTPGQRATHLRRLATIRIKPMADLMTDVLSTEDSRRWNVQPKRERHAYATVQYAGSSGTGATWAEMNAHIASMGVAGLVSGAVSGEYRIRLAPTVMESDSYPADPYTRFTAPAATVLAAVTGIRVVLIGTPGKTIIPFWFGATGVRCLDVCWVTITRVRGNGLFMGDAGSVRLGAYLVGQRTHTRFFGCVIDGIDATASVQALNTDTAPPAAVFEFYDGMITGLASAITANSVDSAATRPAPRVIVARSIIDATNDQVQLYGQVRILLEGNHFIGAGGWYVNRAWQHRDTMTQVYNVGFPTSYAAYNNIVQCGPNHQVDLNLRAASNLFMQQNGMMDAFEMVGNIFVQEPTLSSRGINEFEPIRKPDPTPPIAKNTAYFYRACVAYNMFIYLPDQYSSGDTYPAHAFGWVQARTGTATRPQILDNVVAFGNLSVRHADSRIQLGFDRVVNFFPEEVAARPDLLDVADAFAAFPAVTGTWMGGYALDWSGTAYAGTSREGYLSPSDLVVSTPLRRWSADGLTGGPGLPFHGSYMDRLLELPANINVHLGWVDEAGDDFGGSGYLPDWFGAGGYNPTPGTLDATVVDPWTPQSGDTVVEDKTLTIFARLGTLGSGTIIEETAADGARWTLDILPTTHRPRFTVRDSGSSIVYQMVGAYPVKANSRLLVGVETRYRRHIQESFAHWTILKRMMYEHYRVNASTDDFIIDFEAAATAPTRVAGADHYIWIDLSDFNTVKVWSGAAWVPAQGDMSEVGSFWAAGRADQEPDGVWEQEYRHMTVPALRDRFYLAENADTFLAGPRTVAPATDDWVFLISDADNEFSSASVRRWNGSAWATSSPVPGALAYSNRVRAPNSPTMRGLPNILLRVDGRNCIRLPDWISANNALNYGRAFLGLPRDHPSVTLDFPVADPTKLVVYARPWVLHHDGYIWQTGSMVGNALVPGLDYSVAINADQVANPGGTVTFLRDLPGYNGNVRVDSKKNIVPDEVATSTDVRVRLNYTAVDYGARGMDRPLPRGTVRVGAAVGVEAYSGTLSQVGARRFKGYATDKLELVEPTYPEWASSGLDHRFARQPAYIDAGLVEHPVFSVMPDVWVVA